MIGDDMKLIVGLGNPGSEYAATRHNIGFMVLQQLALKWGVTDWKFQEEALVADYRFKCERILLVKPQTFMNNSGVAVSALARFFKIPETDILVIYDDLDLAVGKLRLRAKGTSGGHRGLGSIILHLGKDTLSRIKIGISHPTGMRPVVDHVLTPFTTEEVPLIRDAIGQAVLATEAWLTDGIAPAMNQFNKNK